MYYNVTVFWFQGGDYFIMSGFMDEWVNDGLAREDRFGELFQIHRDTPDGREISGLRIIRIPASEEEYETAKKTVLAEEEAHELFYEMLERITGECRVMESLSENPNILGCREYEAVENEEGFGWTVYIRTELLRPLLSYAGECPMTVPDVVQLGIEIADALAGCRMFEIIHRDVSPETIFVTEDRHFKLGGFDLAHEREKVASDRAKKNQGTYVSPEQYGGKNYSYESDQYSLGLILYRFLNHDRMPFYPPSSQPVRYHDRELARQKILDGKTVPPPDGADEALGAIIQKACAFKPERRYGSAAELRDALLAYANS